MNKGKSPITILAQTEEERSACQGRGDRILETRTAIAAVAIEYIRQIGNNCKGSVEVVLQFTI